MIFPKGISEADEQIVKDFHQFLQWAGPVIATREKAPFRHLAHFWLDGLMTIEEGQRIEAIERERRCWYDGSPHF